MSNTVLNLESLPVLGVNIVAGKKVLHSIVVRFWYNEYENKETRKFIIEDGELSEADKTCDFWKRAADTNVCDITIQYFFC
jgi:hypothetical protein